MNILVISSHLPYPPNSGGLIRLYNLYSRLGQRHRLAWLSPIWADTESDVAKVREFCAEVVPLPLDENRPLPDRGWRRFLVWLIARLHWERLFVLCFGYVSAPGLYWLAATPSRQSAVHHAVSEFRPDLIIAEFEGNAELVRDTPELPRVICLHNIQSCLYERTRRIFPLFGKDRLLYWAERAKIALYEKRNYRHYHAAIVVSESDRRRLAKLLPELAVAVLPNGVDVSFFQPGFEQAGNSDTNTTVVYTGHYGYPPNRDAVIYFCQEILPLIHCEVPDAEFLVVGHEPPAELAGCPGVRLVGAVPDVRPYLARASVVIAPLRAGGGTRVKILEALAMGKAIVSTTVGAEGLDVTPGFDLLIADNPVEFAGCVVRLLREPLLRAELGNRGRRLVEQRYRWDMLADQLEVVLTNTVLHHEQLRHAGGKEQRRR